MYLLIMQFVENKIVLTILPRGGFNPLEWFSFEEGIVYLQKPPTRNSLDIL